MDGTVTYRLEDILERIELHRPAKEAYEVNDDTYPDSRCREFDRLVTLKELLEQGFTVDDFASGQVLVNNEYVVALLSKKWQHRNNLNKRWYSFDNTATLSRYFENY